MVNHERKPSPGYLALHRASCYTLDPSRQPGRAWTHAYAKTCGLTVEELDDWGRRVAKGTPSPCSACDPTGQGRQPRPVRSKTGSVRAERQAWPGASGLPTGVPRASPGDFALYDRPNRHVIPLSTPPRLESWDAASSPSQVALRGYVDELAELAEPKLRAFSGPPALALRVGLPPDVALDSGGRDLDNYVFPVVRRLGADRFDAVWAEKAHGASSLAVDSMSPIQAPPVSEGWSFAGAVPGSSAQSKRWKEELSSQFPQVDTGTGPIALHVAFRVSKARNWSALWKPAIDSLGGILGVENLSQPFHPRDDRIVVLGLHRMIDEAMGWKVAVGAWWRPY